MKRFRWTRASYRHAHQLARLLNRYLDLPDHPPAIVRRYWELWDRHRQGNDPLAEPIRQRSSYLMLRDGIPF